MATPPTSLWPGGPPAGKPGSPGFIPRAPPQFSLPQSPAVPPWIAAIPPKPSVPTFLQKFSVPTAPPNPQNPLPKFGQMVCAKPAGANQPALQKVETAVPLPKFAAVGGQGPGLFVPKPVNPLPKFQGPKEPPFPQPSGRTVQTGPTAPQSTGYQPPASSTAPLASAERPPEAFPTVPLVQSVLLCDEQVEPAKVVKNEVPVELLTVNAIYSQSVIRKNVENPPVPATPSVLKLKVGSGFPQNLDMKSLARPAKPSDSAPIFKPSVPAPESKVPIYKPSLPPGLPPGFPSAQLVNDSASPGFPKFSTSPSVPVFKPSLQQLPQFAPPQPSVAPAVPSTVNLPKFLPSEPPKVAMVKPGLPPPAPNTVMASKPGTTAPVSKPSIPVFSPAVPVFKPAIPQLPGGAMVKEMPKPGLPPPKPGAFVPVQPVVYRPTTFMCGNCKSTVDQLYTEVRCPLKDCKVCVPCMISVVQKAQRRCPLCSRTISDYELEIIQIYALSLEIK